MGQDFRVMAGAMMHDGFDRLVGAGERANPGARDYVVMLEAETCANATVAGTSATTTPHILAIRISAYCCRSVQPTGVTAQRKAGADRARSIGSREAIW